jgi:VIT1/CCC1 family predicted Fe2+/Mn2+ transporter
VRPPAASGRAGEPATPQPGDGLVRAGGIVFLVGVIAVVVAVVPFFFGHENWPLPVNLAAGVLPPLGLLLALVGVVRGARSTARANRRAAAQR